MLKATITIHPGTDAETELTRLKAKAEAARLPSDVTNQMCEQAREVIGSIMTGAALMARTVGTLRVTRLVVGPGYRVDIVAGVEPKVSLVTRVRRALGMH